MLRFYSISPDDLEHMAKYDFEMLYQCIAVIVAREALVAIKVADYPQMNKEGRRKTFESLKKQAFPSILKAEARAITMAELADFISKGV